MAGEDLRVRRLAMLGLTRRAAEPERYSRTPRFAADRAHKREDLLLATKRDLARIQARVGRERSRLRTAAEISLAVGPVLNRRKMTKHFVLGADRQLRFPR